MDNHNIHRELHVPETEVMSRMAARLGVIEATQANEQVLWPYYGLVPAASQTPVPTAGAEVTPTAVSTYSESNTSSVAAGQAVIGNTVAAEIQNPVDWEQQQRATAARMTIGEVHQQMREEAGYEHLA